jgi:hypothetical protein
LSAIAGNCTAATATGTLVTTAISGTATSGRPDPEAPLTTPPRKQPAKVAVMIAESISI